MALTLPKIVGPAISSVKAPKNLFGSAPKKAPAKKKKTGGASPTYDPYAGLLLPTTDPSTFSATASKGYASDTARAGELAAMGMPTDQSISDTAAARAAGLGQISAALQQHLAGIQQAGVAQGNTQQAGFAQLSTPVAGIPGAPAPVADPAIAAGQATLAGQTAGTGNYLGTVEAGAALGGAKTQQDTLEQGGRDVLANQQSRAKILAQLEGAIPSVDSRVADLQTQNDKIGAANAGTKLTVWQNIQNRLLQDKLSGDKIGLAEDQLAERKWETSQNAAAALERTKTQQAGATDRTNAQQAGANARTDATVGGANARTDANIRADAWQKDQQRKTDVAIQKMKSATTLKAADIKALKKSPYKSFNVSVDTKGGPRSVSGGNVTIDLPQKNHPIHVTAEQWYKFLASGPFHKRNVAILGLKPGTMIHYDTAVGH